MNIRLGKAAKLAGMALAVAAAVALPLSASARGWHGGGHGGYYGGYHGGYHGYRGYGGGYRHGGYWSGGRWIAGALVAGATIGLIDSALQPRPVYYGPPAVVYSDAPPGSVVYQDGPPVVTRRVVTRTTVYEDPYQTRYIGDDGYDGN